MLGFQCRVKRRGRSGILIGPEQRATQGPPEPWAQSRWGMELVCQGPEGHLPTPQCPAPEAQAIALPPPPVMVPPDYCTPQLPSPPGSPSPGPPAAACLGRGCLQGGEDCPPLLDRQTGGVGVETWREGGSGAPPRTQGPGQCGDGPHPPARLQAHFSGALPAPTFRPVEPRTPLSLPAGGQSSWQGGVPGAGSSEGRSLGLRPRFFPLAGLFSFLGTGESMPLCLGGGSAEVRNQF